MSIISKAYAEGAAPAAQGGGMEMIIMLAVFGLIFYFMIYRPQAKRAKEHRNLMSSLSKGDEVLTSGGLVGKIAKRIAGSAARFDHDGRAATSSVNFISAHDGFTLMDTVSYSRKHNDANLEGNRDGHDHNLSDNCGVEGPTEDPEILARRARRRRNLMATLLLSQGTPMILAGDELGNSQGGNNNAYCQDNPIGWIGWDAADAGFLDFCRRLIAFRKAHPILRQKRFLHSQPREQDGIPDLFWRRADGQAMQERDWTDPQLRLVAAEMRMASGTPAYAALRGAVFLVLNAGPETRVHLPATATRGAWRRQFDTSQDGVLDRAAARIETIPPESVVVFVLSES